MITTDLYSKILVEPARKGANSLFMVSGYASATFARRHINDLTAILGEDFSLNLIIGMPKNKVDHRAYLQLHDEFGNRFHGYYLNSVPPVHSKVFSWFNGDAAVEAYSGSANYSQYGFFEDKQVNQMVGDDAVEIKNFYDSLLASSVYMPEVVLAELPVYRVATVAGSVHAGSIEWVELGKTVKISFLDKQGELPGTSGLNWGQRQEKRTNAVTGEVTYVTREPNQAYLSLKGDSRDEGFLPKRGYTFTLLTDDGQSFDCVVAQDGRKAIESTKDNSELGRYFRTRLGLPLGTFVTVAHLEAYGRTDYTISKIDDENFLLDFSRPA